MTKDSDANASTDLFMPGSMQLHQQGGQPAPSSFLAQIKAMNATKGITPVVNEDRSNNSGSINVAATKLSFLDMIKARKVD